MLPTSIPPRADEIVYGLVPDSPPTTFIDEDGKPSGFLVELFSRILDELGYKYRYEVAPFSQLYPRMVSGEIDFFTTLLKTQERERVFYYPEIPALSGWGAFFVAEYTDYQDLRSLNGKVIGVVRDDMNGQSFKEFADAAGILFSTEEYENFEELIDSVRTGEVFGGVVYNTSLVGVEGINITTTVFNPRPGYPVTSLKGDFIDDLERIMERFRQLKSDDDSYYYDLLNKWFYRSEGVSPRVFVTVLVVMAVALTLLMILYFINRLLRRENHISRRELKLSNMIVSNSAEGVLITDAEARILKINPGFTSITGYSLEDVAGKTPAILKSGKQDNIFYNNLWKNLLDTGSWKGEIINKKKNGELYVQSTSIVSIRDNKGKLTNFTGVLEDITLMTRYKEQLQYQTLHDDLTDLPNRKFFAKMIEIQMDIAQKEGLYLSLILMNIRRFKSFNNVYGHFKGDRLLQEVTRLLKGNLPENTFLSRMGNDEFSIIAFSEDQDTVEREIPEKIQSIFNKPVDLGELFQVSINLNLGVALYPTDTEDHQDIYKKADLALNCCKGKKEQGISRFRQDMEQQAMSRMHYESLLRYCLERDEVHILYQPKLDLLTRRISGVEALIRWRPGNGTMVPTDEFISMAEEMRMIIPISEFVLERSCSQILELNSGLEKPITLAVNLSGIQFTESDMDKTIYRIISSVGFPPELLELEITESVAINHLKEVPVLLRKMREKNISIAMDDFGTGFSSLSYLKDLPLDILKIDKAFIQNVLQGEEDSEIVKAIISLAQILNLRVVAEGVEDESQMNYLAENNCSEFQGYLLSPPMEYEELKRFIGEFDYFRWRIPADNR